MAKSFVLYDGDGANRDFNVPFGYIKQAHVHVYVGGVEDTTFTWNNDTQIKTTTAPPVGTDNVLVKRQTPSTAEVTFFDPSTRADSDLNTGNLQALYLAEELEDSRLAMVASTMLTWTAQSQKIENVADGTVGKDAVNWDQLNTAIVGGNGVPNPVNPTDDNKVLRATGGTYGWFSFLIDWISDLPAWANTFLKAADKRTAMGTTAYTETLLDDASAGAARTTLGSGATGDALFQDATAAAARTTLGLGTAAVLNEGTAGADLISVTNLLQWLKSGDKLYFPKVGTGADVDHDIVTTSGAVMAQNVADLIICPVLTKQIDAAWVVGNNQGGMFTGTVAANTTYHFFAIKKDSDGSVDYGFDTSQVAANIPAGYTNYRRIASFITDASANLIPFDNVGDFFWYKTPIQDLNSTTIGTTPTTVTLSIPVDSILQWVGYINANNAETTGILVRPAFNANLTPTAPGSTTSPGHHAAGNGSVSMRFDGLMTNASGQIKVSASAASTDVVVYTEGYIDPRIE